MIPCRGATGASRRKQCCPKRVAPQRVVGAGKRQTEFTNLVKAKTRDINARYRFERKAIVYIHKMFENIVVGAFTYSDPATRSSSDTDSRTSSGTGVLTRDMFLQGLGEYLKAFRQTEKLMCRPTKSGDADVYMATLCARHDTTLLMID